MPSAQFDDNHNNHKNIIIIIHASKVGVVFFLKKGWEAVLNCARLVSGHNVKLSTLTCFFGHEHFASGAILALLQGFSKLHTCAPLSLLCPSLASHLDSLKYRTPGPARLKISSSQPTAQAWISTEAHGSLYGLQIYMVKIATHGITCICKFANQTQC